MRFRDLAFAVGGEMEEKNRKTFSPHMFFEDGGIYIQAKCPNKTASRKAHETKWRNRDRSTFEALIARLLVDNMS